MKLELFNGGISRALRPKYLQANEAAELVNCDTDIGSLGPVKLPGAGFAAPEGTGDYVSFNGELQRVPVGAAKFEFDNKLYYVGDDGYLRERLQNGTERLTGLPTPAAAPTLESRNGSQPIDNVEVSVNVGVNAGAPNTPTQYAFVYRSNGETYSEPLIVDVETETTLVSYRVKVNFLGKTKRKTKIVTPDVREVTFSDFGKYLSISSFIKVARLVKGQFYFIGTIVDSTPFVDAYTDDEVEALGYGVLEDQAFNELDGTYTYVYTQYNADTGVESGPSPVSADIDCTSTDRLTMKTPSLPAPYIAPLRRLYRVGGELTKFTMVDEFSYSVFGHADKLADSDIAANKTLDTEGYEAPPLNLTSLAETSKMLFGSVGSSLRFTPVAVPHAWPETYQLPFRRDIVALATSPAGVLVMLPNEVHVVMGAAPAQVQTYVISSDQGCANARSVQSINGLTIWVSNDGICFSTGSEVTLVSKAKLGITNLSDCLDSAIFNRCYYVLQPGGKLTCLDFSDATPKFKEFTLPSDAVTLTEHNDKLYYGNGVNLYEMFASTENAEFKYVSPEFTEGSQTSPKLYKKVRAYHKGDIIIKIRIDGQEVATREMTGTGSHEVLIPVEHTRGYGLQFEIVGTGELLELDYTVETAK